jgi:hypothetical protein
MLSGSGPDNFAVRPISTTVGCVAPNSIVAGDQFALFMSDLGVYSVTSNGNGVVRMSYNIQNIIDGVSATTRAAVVAGRYKTQYWMVITYQGSPTCFVLDWVLGAWTRYSRCKAYKFLTRQNGDLLWQNGGSFDNTDIMIGNTGNYDEDQPAAHGTVVSNIGISAVWYSKDYDFGKFVHRKILHDIVTMAQPLASQTMTIQYCLNGIVQGTTFTFTLTPSSTETIKLHKIGRHPPDSGQKNFFKFVFTSPSTNTGAPAFYGYSATAEVYPRENG